MSYCTQQDLIDRYGESELIELTDREQVGEINTAILDRAISDADGEIDGYLIKFVRPIAPVPKVLVRIACDITRFYLYDDQATDLVEKRYFNAVKFLQGVSRGEISIGVDVAGVTPESSTGGGKPQMAVGQRVFNSDTLKGF